MATTTTVLKDTPLLCVIKQVIDDGDYGEILDLSHARVVYMHSDQVVSYRIPAINDGTGLPEDHSTAAGVGVDVPTSEGTFEPTATVAGRIAENLMPAYLQLKNASGSQATVKIIIACDLNGIDVYDDSTSGAVRFLTGVGV